MKKFVLFIMFLLLASFVNANGYYDDDTIYGDFYRPQPYYSSAWSHYYGDHSDTIAFRSDYGNIIYHSNNGNDFYRARSVGVRRNTRHYGDYDDPSLHSYLSYNDGYTYSYSGYGGYYPRSFTTTSRRSYYTRSYY